MASSIRALIAERRYPFLVTLALFLLSLLLVFLLSSNPTGYIPFVRDLRSSQPLLPPPPPPLPPPPPPALPISIPDPDPRPQANYTGSNDGERGVEGGGGDRDAGATGGEIEVFLAEWKVCKGGNGYEAADYIPCLDNWKAIKELKSRRHMEHRERHCPKPSPRCLVPLPPRYRTRVPWPKSRDMIWYDNVPHPKLVEYKKSQNWVQKSGDYLVFPGGGTQFKDGVSNYIQFIEQILPTVNWGRRIRVVLDVGCGVASFGSYLLEKDVITMSFAPKDEHEAQIQFALERGIPAFLSVIGTQKLPFPDNVFDLIHCARCRVHWDADGGQPLLELNRILRPGGFFVWSATPVYRDDRRDQTVWNAMVALAKSFCWKTLVKSTDNLGIGVVVYQKPVSNSCYEQRKEKNPPLCIEKDGIDIAWYASLDSCLPPIPVTLENNWPASWPGRLNSVSSSNHEESNDGVAQTILYDDGKQWEKLVAEVYMHNVGINWSDIRNVMDMNAGFGGFAAALVTQPLWVMNTVPVHGPDTLQTIFDRGLIGIYHDWCEAFNTYPRTYDLLYSSFLFEKLSQRCDIVDVVVEMERIVRPNGWVLIQDKKEMVKRLQSMLQSLHWSTSVQNEQILVGKKSFWRPDTVASEP